MVEASRVKVGGLMRCCLETLAQRLETGGSSDEGQVFPCLFCSSSMVCHGNCWEWNHG